ncbi:carbohydrate ABC transporter permease [Phaeovulum sp. W22_SRMD_FR3]|uniref:carbohydrate ABC transporter permease n=1 Tax=Phaeovulum sp. W22_SRMD_FR3 TaxID=3240274 RepID=UPI003F9A5491
MTMRRQTLTAWLLLLPAVLLLTVFTHGPALRTVVASFFTTPHGRIPSKFAGLDNYAHLIADPVFWQALRNNLVYAGITIPLSMALALVMALIVNDRLRGRGFLRMAYFTPTVLPLIAVANIWIFFYQPGFGLIDQIRGLLGLRASNLLGQGDSALYAISAVAVWKEAGFFMIFYLAALQNIPQSLIEAARLEGASRLQIFRRVTLPLLAPTTLFVAVNAVVNAFRLVDHIYQMTSGGPNNATTLLFYYLYQVGFQFWDTGYAATITTVLVLFLALISIGQFLLLDRKVHYQ